MLQSIELKNRVQTTRISNVEEKFGVLKISCQNLFLPHLFISFQPIALRYFITWYTVKPMGIEYLIT